LRRTSAETAGFFFPYFGVNAFWSVQGNFDLETTDGAFVTPEPATVTLTAGALLLWARMLRRRQASR